MYDFDIFLSYQSHDEPLVQKLKSALHDRGVRVWLDKEMIRPGDLYAEALEEGIRRSRAVGLLVSPRSIASRWVREEYYRSLSLAANGSLQLIPLLFEDVELPGFLDSRQYVDFKDPLRFDSSVDSLVWPGITGKRIACIVVSGLWYGSYYNKTEHWGRLLSILKQRPVVIEEVEGMMYSEHPLLEHLGYGEIGATHDLWWRSALPELRSIRSPSRFRVVLITDIFESRSDSTRLHHSATPSEWANMIFKMRDLTKGTDNELVTILFQPESVWGCTEQISDLTDDQIVRLKHYFTLHQEAGPGSLETQFDAVWKRVQAFLMRSEH